VAVLAVGDNMSLGQLFLGVMINGAITYILYRIDSKVALIYVGLLLLMMLTVYRIQFFAAFNQLQRAIGGLGLEA